jgi:hypothetical protein
MYPGCLLAHTFDVNYLNSRHLLIEYVERHSYND